MLGGESLAVLAEAVAEVRAHRHGRYAATSDTWHVDRHICVQAAAGGAGELVHGVTHA
jgi:hypothetical protein